MLITQIFRIQFVIFFTPFSVTETRCSVMDKMSLISFMPKKDRFPVENGLSVCLLLSSHESFVDLMPYLVLEFVDIRVLYIYFDCAGLCCKLFAAVIQAMAAMEIVV